MIAIQSTKTLNFISLLLLSAVLTGGCRTAQRAADPAANARANGILEYMRGRESSQKKRIISGQFDNFGSRANLHLLNRVHESTGHWPALVGVDYADEGGINWRVPNKAAIEYWNAGGLVTVSTHLYNPCRTNEYGGLRDKGVDLNALLVEGSDTHGRWMRELDRVADGLQQLKDAGVVVLWRPFHEMNGDWFWWGAKDPALFIQLWRQMFQYYTKTRHLDNLLWVYSPNHGDKTAAYYPGDEYVDLIGLDAYTDYIETNHIKGYPEMARIKKPFGFTEFGPHSPSNPPGDYDYRRFLKGVQQDFPRTVFFMSWNAKWSLASNTNVAEFLSSPSIVNREDLPKGIAGPHESR